jgi:cell division protein ZapE
VNAGGRKVFVPRAERGVAFFTFEELCKQVRSNNSPHASPSLPPVSVDVLSHVLIWIRLQALGAADYIAISKEFHTVIVSGIPKMEDRHREQAKRFITLVDELYNHKVTPSPPFLPQ